MFRAYQILQEIEDGDRLVVFEGFIGVHFSLFVILGDDPQSCFEEREEIVAREDLVLGLTKDIDDAR